MSTCELLQHELTIDDFKVQGQIIIAGFCSIDRVNSRGLVLETATEAVRRGVVARFGYYKPRTEPSEDFFDGIYQDDQKECLEWLIDVCNMGVVPALEVNSPEMAQDILNVVKNAQKPKIILWIGSRNQEQRRQVDIARKVAACPWAMLMIKNQPWPDEKHWRGIIKYATDEKFGGIPKNRLLVCHRGFYPSKNDPNPRGLRNLADFEMAKRIEEEMDVEVLIDCSHIGGTVDNVIWAIREAKKHNFNDFVLEVGDPKKVRTDTGQHLTWEQFDSLNL